MKFLSKLLVLLPLLLFITSPAFAHNDMMGGSKWYLGRDNIVAVFEVAPSLLAKIKGITERHLAIETCNEKQLQEAVDRVIQPYLDRNLSVTVNGKRCSLKVRNIKRSSDLLWEVWLSCDGIRYDLPENAVKIDYRLFFDETDDLHFNLAYIYAYDAKRRPPEKVEDSAFLARNTFDTANPVWETTVQAAPAASAAKSFLWNCGTFVLLGIKHILTGYDHIAFLLALVVVGLSLKEVFKIITAFTVAHSVTLLLAALEIVTVNPRLVEIAIAVSICYIAVENLFTRDVRHRWLITFAFGLIHGFGFATMLRELLKQQSGLLSSVVSFNVGVEVGQMLIFLVMIPVLQLARQRFAFQRVCAAISMAILAIGLGWLVERVFDLKFLPL